jgi:hypothetical protein
LRKQNRKWTNYVYHNKTEVKVHVPYYLEYTISRLPMNCII